MPNENTHDKLLRYRKNEARIDELRAQNEQLAREIADTLHELVKDYQTVDFEQGKTTIEDYRQTHLAVSRGQKNSPYQPAAELAQVIDDEDELHACIERGHPTLRIEDDAVTISMAPYWRDDDVIECHVPTTTLTMTKPAFDEYVRQSLSAAGHQVELDKKAAKCEADIRELAEWERLNAKFGGFYG